MAKRTDETERDTTEYGIGLHFSQTDPYQSKHGQYLWGYLNLGAEIVAPWYAGSTRWTPTSNGDFNGLKITAGANTDAYIQGMGTLSSAPTHKFCIGDVDLEDAQRIVRVLEPLNKKMAALQKKYGPANDFASYVLRVADCLGIEKFFVRDDQDNYQEVDSGPEGVNSWATAKTASFNKKVKELVEQIAAEKAKAEKEAAVEAAKLEARVEYALSKPSPEEIEASVTEDCAAS